MDYTIIFIGILLVFTGALCIGYPIGFQLGKRSVWKEIQDDYVIVNFPENAEPSVVTASKKRLEKADVLDAEILEEQEIRCQ